MLNKYQRENRREIQMISIEDLIPENHILRDIDEAINLDFIYDEVKDLYCDKRPMTKQGFFKKYEYVYDEYLESQTSTKIFRVSSMEPCGSHMRFLGKFKSLLTKRFGTYALAGIAVLPGRKSSFSPTYPGLTKFGALVRIHNRYSYGFSPFSITVTIKL